MSEFIKIKLEIANRLYPLTIKPSQEESLRKSASRIDQMIKKFEKNYEVRDKQDVLAMCALQFASIAEKINQNSKEKWRRCSKITNIYSRHNDFKLK